MPDPEAARGEARRAAREAELARAHAILADIAGETGRAADRLDVEELLSTARFTSRVYGGGAVRVYTRDDLRLTVHTDTELFPIDQARWLAGQIRKRGLLEEV